jgi:peptidoglycan/LPS O-acetylase OafA/YrhL
MSERIRHIDGLRGIAVLAVVLFHAGVHNSALTAAHASPLAFVLSQGCHGVDLFFILSGFCLSYPTLARIAAGGAAQFDLCAFGARRLVRIVPPYYAALIACAVLGFTLPALALSVASPIPHDALSLGPLVKQALFLDHDRNYVNASFWTLAVEFRWYFAFPLMLWLWIRHRRVFGVVAVAAVLAGSTRMESVDVFFLPFFMLGTVAAHLYVRNMVMRPHLLGAAIVAVMLAFATTAGSDWSFSESPFWGVAMFCVVVTAGSLPVLRTLLCSKWLVAVGGASYGIYLIHEPVVALIESLTVPIAGASGAYVLAVAAGVAVGFAFSWCAERPFVRSRLRDVMVKCGERALAPLFARAGVPRTVSFAPEQTAPPRLKVLAG